MESLFAYSILWAWGFCSMEEYNAYLDMKFASTPNDDLLLELEECCGDYKKTFARLKRYFEYEANTFDVPAFGKMLFAGLKKAYRSESDNIAVFARKCYENWTLLPENMGMKEPFWTFSYADDPLSWGDEKQTRELLEKAFDFYKQ